MHRVKRTLALGVFHAVDALAVELGLLPFLAAVGAVG